LRGEKVNCINDHIFGTSLTITENAWGIDKNTGERQQIRIVMSDLDTE
jgi:hypothetical protein